jgi:hypothetical protein
MDKTITVIIKFFDGEYKDRAEIKVEMLKELERINKENNGEWEIDTWLPPSLNIDIDAWKVIYKKI